MLEDCHPALRGVFTVMPVAMAMKRPRSLDAAGEGGGTPVDPSSGDVPLQLANGFCERDAQSLIESERIVHVLKQAHCLNGPLDGPGNYSATVLRCNEIHEVTRKRLENSKAALSECGVDVRLQLTLLDLTTNVNCAFPISPCCWVRLGLILTILTPSPPGKKPTQACHGTSELALRGACV